MQPKTEPAAVHCVQQLKLRIVEKEAKRYRILEDGRVLYVAEVLVQT